MPTVELLGILAATVASLFALVRHSLTQQREQSRHFTQYLEEALKRQEAVNSELRTALTGLSQTMERHARVLHRLVRKLEGEGGGGA